MFVLEAGAEKNLNGTSFVQVPWHMCTVLYHNSELFIKKDV